MKYVKLGNSDLVVSRRCLGTLSFGDPTREGSEKWLLSQEETDAIVRRALELGINFFDTANYYNGGSSEEFLGSALAKYAKRDDVIVATKVFYNEGGLSRRAILREIDYSLQKLKMDHVDLLIIHRWDHRTPIEETMEALNDVIKAGKTRYIGASTMHAYQFLKAQETARHHGWQPFISMQNHYNMIYREDEREMVRLLKEENVPMTPYSPLAAGRLSRVGAGDSRRARTDDYSVGEYDHNRDKDLPIILRVKELAEKHGVSMAQISLAWLTQKDMVAAPVVGVTKTRHLEDAVASVDITLDAEEMRYLDELYVPHQILDVE